MPRLRPPAGSVPNQSPRLHGAGLYRSFDAGTIYCSAVTANLLKYDMRMPPERIHPLPMDEPVTIDGVTVTLMSANHCPGAVMMLFQVSQPGSSKVQVGSHAHWTLCPFAAWKQQCAGWRWCSGPLRCHSAAPIAAPGSCRMYVGFEPHTGQSMLLKTGSRASGADLARHCIQCIHQHACRQEQGALLYTHCEEQQTAWA